MKRSTKLAKGVAADNVGDAFTFVGIERNTKLILAGILDTATLQTQKPSQRNWIAQRQAVSRSLQTV